MRLLVLYSSVKAESAGSQNDKAPLDLPSMTSFDEEDALNDSNACDKEEQQQCGRPQANVRKT